MIITPPEKVVFDPEIYPQKITFSDKKQMIFLKKIINEQKIKLETGKLYERFFYFLD